MNILYPYPTEGWAEKFTETLAYVRERRAGAGLDDAPFDVFDGGHTPGDDDPAESVRLGATWWMESLDPWRYGWDGSERWPEMGPMRERIRQGPPRG